MPQRQGAIGMAGCWAAVTALALLAALVLTGGTARAQGLPARPTVAPTKAPEPERTATEVPAGRITGTVIDLTSGAPSPGVNVSVGGQVVTTDTNGNYDRSGLAAGTYRVALELAPGQGEAAQGPAEVTLTQGATVVLHLAFRSAAPATPTPSVTPAALPATGGDSPAAMLGALGLVLAAAGARLARRRA